MFRHVQDEPGFRGAYLGGSTISLPDEAELPATSERRAGLIRGALPGLWQLATKIMSGNLEVIG
ncbi:MAG: hypothetical protein ACRDWG_08705 [Actinomycetes bacterium]